MTPESLELVRKATNVMYISGLPIINTSPDSTEINNDSMGEKGNLIKTIWGLGYKLEN